MKLLVHISGNKKNVGRPLNMLERTFYDSYFPSDILDAVTIYIGNVPWWLRKSMAAVTLGNRIYFRQNVYVPNTQAGIEILGHELTHVQQFATGMTCASYLWACRKGYFKNNFEIEAYRVGAKIRSDFCAYAKK